MVLTAEGRIFGWGRGSFGRLGTGLEKDCHSPVEVFLPGQLLVQSIIVTIMTIIINMFMFVFIIIVIIQNKYQ